MARSVTEPQSAILTLDEDVKSEGYKVHLYVLYKCKIWLSRVGRSLHIKTRCAPR